MCLYLFFYPARDFNDTVIETEIPPGQTLLMQPIQIFDDEINEARENFEVALEIVSNISNVVMYRRRTTLCRIRQSDRKSYLAHLMYAVFRIVILIYPQFTTIVICKPIFT